MSLWTPSGEHPVGREAPAGPAAGAPSSGARPPGAPSSGARPPGAPSSGADAQDAAAQLDELRRQLADSPPEVVIANHCFGLFELAAVYLSQSPPRLQQAQLAIDALGCLVDGLGARLGEAHRSLADALAQVRLAYVQLGAAEKARAAGTGNRGDGNGTAGRPTGGG
jgi:hypothetical protein